MTSMAGKAQESQLKQSSSPRPMQPQADRKSSVPNAWAKGNPVTQRPVGSANANGITSPPVNKAPTAPKSSNMALPTESNTSDKHANDRLLFLTANFKGLQATVVLRNGEKYSGIFSSAVFDQAEPKYLLKMVKKVGQENKQQVNGTSDQADAYAGAGPNFSMTFPIREVADLNVKDVSLNKGSRAAQNGASGFKTDTDISRGFNTRERQLQRWDAGPENDVDLSLESGTNGKPWDQFEANERLYGLESNYDESFYTTSINRSAPDFKKREAEAERLAREIESGVTTNSHVAEERGQKPQEDRGEDEEDLYSGVRRDYKPLSSGGNAYTPPALRAPTAQSTVPGAPVDPAIISSSLAKPEKTSTAKENEAPAAPSTTASSKPKPQDNLKIESAKAQASASKPVLPVARLSPNKEGCATATVEKDVANAFKQFAATEKLKAQETHRLREKRASMVKLNDLKKFAQNFKLHTPVPTDLVPILAKDKGKQDKIVEQAMKNVSDFKSPQSKSPEIASTAVVTDTKVAKPTGPKGSETTPTPPAVQPERPNQRNRQSQANFNQNPRANDRSTQAANNARPGQIPYAQRLQQQYQRQPIGPLPHQLHDPRLPTGPAATGVQSPPGRITYNNKITEFKPNPAANTFQPLPSQSSGSSPARAASANPEQPKRGNFFEGRRPIVSADERPSITTSFNSIIRMSNEVKADGKEEIFASNGGIPRPFQTPPIWDVPDANRETKYTQVFEKERMPSVSPAHNMMPHQQPMPHQHQLPMHLQGGPVASGHTPQQTPRHMPAQPHVGPNGYPHHDDQRMQYSHSTSSVHPSPRPMHPYMAYNGQGSPSVQGYPQGVPSYGMSPGGYPMAMRQVSNGPQYMQAGGPQMGGYAMTPQASSGPHMNMQMNPQVPMFSPVPGQVHPHHNGPMPQGGAGGYPSPRPPAQMMAHQGSQQGHHPQMMYTPPGQHGVPGAYGQPPTGPMGPMRGPYPGPQPIYGSSPHQQHHFPQQHRGTPSANYVQPMVNNHGPPHGVPHNNGPQVGADGPDDGK